MSNTDKTYDGVTALVLEAMERLGSDWIKPWTSNAVGTLNPTTDKHYRGVLNQIILGITAWKKDYSHGLWAGFGQWKKAGHCVDKGQKSTYILRPKMVKRSDDDGDRTVCIGFMGAAVFNVHQLKNADSAIAQFATFADEPELPEDNRHCAIDSWVDRTGANIHHGSQSAFYRPGTDSIHMPDFGVFKDAGYYYGTLLHELTHWTGAKDRLNRLSDRFDRADYAREELVAELGAAYLCHDHGIEPTPRDDHAQYLNNWMQALRTDSGAIFDAAKKSTAACRFLHGAASA